MIQHANRPTRLCLVRHGETAWNAERRLQGHIDVPLNETGESQARASAALLAQERFDVLYCSDLARARRTALVAAERIGLALTLEPRLRERHYGAFQGLTYEEAEQRYPEAYAHFHAREPAFAFPDGGESLTAFAGRVRSALEQIVARHPGQSVLIVTHGGVLDIAHRIASGKPLEAERDFSIPNAALNWLEHAGGNWRILAWAQQAHLDAARDELPNA
jgi:probable phosphoglycerate mutase